jgi:hypothetical protein
VILDATAAKEKLKARGDPKDPMTRKMLAVIDGNFRTLHNLKNA